MTARELKRRIPRKAALASALVGILIVVGTAFAVHDEEFQLDRNTADDDPPIGGVSFATAINDWENLFTTDPSLPLTGVGNRPTEKAPLPDGFTDADFEEDWAMVDGVFQTNDPTTFTQSKDIDDISSWRCKAANQVTNKGDITNNYVAVYEKDGRKILYFGLEKDQDSGDNNVALWLIQDEISCAGGGSGNGNAFVGNHTVGDVLLVSEFTNGGGVSSIKAYRWVADINPKPNITTPGVDPNPFAVGADCNLVGVAPYPSPSASLTPAQESDRICATSNTAEFEPAWTHWSFDNGLNSGLRPATFLEGGVSLNEFPQFSNVCFNRFLFNTRSSQELTATLFDYSLGSIGTCDGNISITPSATNQVGQPHTFTIVATSLSSAIPTSFAFTTSVSPAPDSQSNTCATPTLSNGGKTATCTLTITDAQPGTFTANATVVINYSGGSSITRDTDPATADIGSGAGGTGPATKTYVDARITIAASGTNQVGTAHTFTVTVQKDSGSGFVAAPGVTVATALDAASTDGSITGGTCTTTTTNASGQCTVIVDSATTGTAIVDASATVTVAGAVGSANVAVDIEGYGAYGTIGRTKTWVDARISIATSGTNKVNDAHTFTVTVEKDSGSGFVAAQGVDVLASEAGVGSITGGTCDNTGGDTNAAGQCTIIVSSSTTGDSTINASATVSVGGVVGSANVSVATNGYGSNTVSNTKTWADARINIAASGTNQVGTAHTFTVTVQKDSGSGFVAADGVTVTTALDAASSDGSITGGTCTGGGTTNASGQCTVIVNSATTGTAIVDASATVTVAGTVGSANVDVNVEGYGAYGTIGRTKTWVDARITISADATNNITELHTFTVTVQKDSGSGFAAAEGVTVAVSLDGTSTAGSITGGSCTGGGTTDASGQCTVVVQSNVAGTAIVDASATVTVSGVVGSANVAVDVEGYGAYGTIGRTKIWVDGSLTWIKHDGDGELLGGAVFTVCRTHTFNSDTEQMDELTAPGVCVVVGDEDDGEAATSSPDVDLDLGEFKLEDLVLGRYTIVETTPPPGYHGDPKTETVDLTIASPNGAAAAPFVNLRAFRLIVIGCDDITDLLEETEVWIDLNDDDIHDSGETLNTITDLPQYLLDLGVTEADLCGTDDDQDDIPSDGIGGASYGGLDPRMYRATMQIPLL